MTGGYLPTENEIEIIRAETREVLEKWPYPATLSDFSWRAIGQNMHNIRIHNLTPKEAGMADKFHPRILEILFNDKLIRNDDTRGKLLENRMRDFLKTIILNFKYEQRNRTKEKWYIDHVKSLMQNDLFRELWVETDMRDRANAVIGKFATKSFIYPKDTSKMLHFFLFVVPVLKDPRFEIEFLIPQDKETYNFYTSK